MTEDAQVLKADLVRETELRREAERRVQRLQAALDLKPYPDDLDNAERDVQALIGYVQHTSSCESRTDDQVGEAWKRGCTCGLSALLSLLERRGLAEKDKKDEGDTRMATEREDNIRFWRNVVAVV